MADHSSPSKPRQPRLRASCDGCFTAKVKCSKARPICSRCLACGLECRYSPSSRAGKPKSDHQKIGIQRGTSYPILEDIPDNGHITYHSSISHPELHGAEGGWSGSPSPSSSMNRDPAIPLSANMIGLSSHVHDHGGGVDLYSMNVPQWISSAAISPFSDMSIAQPPDTGLSLPYNGVTHWATAASGSSHQLFDPNLSPTQAGIASGYFPSPVATPGSPNRHLFPAPAMADDGCKCFESCLQSLHSLHNASGLLWPPLDAVLFLNGKAVESCVGLLSCFHCTKRSGTQTTMMLMATMLSEAAGIYKVAAQMHMEGLHGPTPDDAPPSSLHRGHGTPGCHDARWLQLGGIVQEVEKLREACTRFRDVCVSLPDDAGINRAMTGYVGRSLGAAMEALKKMQAVW